MPMAFTIEMLDKVLTHPNIEVIARANPTELFERNRDFNLKGTSYSFEWWHNLCYLHIGEVAIPFHSVKQSGTWPNRAKLNLQFYDERGEIVCVVPLEDYPEANP